MTTASELIKYLETLPSDTIVETLKECNGQWSTYVEVVDMQLPDDTGYSDNIEFFDFRDNHFVKPGDSRYGKTYLRIGEK